MNWPPEDIRALRELHELHELDFARLIDPDRVVCRCELSAIEFTGDLETHGARFEWINKNLDIVANHGTPVSCGEVLKRPERRRTVFGRMRLV